LNTNALLFEHNKQLETIILPEAKLRFSEQFFSLNEADNLFQLIMQETQWKQESIFIAGKTRLQPRLTAWYGEDIACYTYSGLQLQPLKWTNTLLQIKQTIEVACQASFNSVLINLYRNEQDSMGWHADNETTLGFQPCIASLSLGETRQFKMKHRTHNNQFYKIPLNNGSLLIMEGNTQEYWIHSIDKEKHACGPRINLTFRQIFP
jgi:alkylated DNA repair dioxygenase AlkB